ncbi:hypothetical protein KKH39_01805 [Patescibacteria group bacterium]|nr:hypothetical protein [Patescibacteria group bacterium]
MNRSKRFVFLSFCATAQGVRAQGIVRKYPAIITPVTEMLTRHKINMVQMPCPELIFDGFCRRPCHKTHYDKVSNRAVCRQLAQTVVGQMILFKDNGNELMAVLGIDFSPSCAVDLIYGEKRQHLRGSGIFVEELQSLMHKQSLRVPMIGIRLYQMEDTLKQLRELLER